ncbi:hypothetical protein E2C01_071940 [Portunus trituberculatus]|uniref:Uncharacterized protein n=1 Tax=Portunus trituberculatus TaxID=210409 RepID=A0A5B7I5T5_PORTR|nr:hypothetical protein [Portunus trituberculatus]
MQTTPSIPPPPSPTPTLLHCPLSHTRTSPLPLSPHLHASPLSTSPASPPYPIYVPLSTLCPALTPSRSCLWSVTLSCPFPCAICPLYICSYLPLFNYNALPIYLPRSNLCPSLTPSHTHASGQ